jgi:hypothetical protein
MPNPFADRSPVRRQRLRALADVHAAWVAEHLAAAEFDRARALVKSPSDYNEHYLDVNPAPDVETDFHARARAAMGLTA